MIVRKITYMKFLVGRLSLILMVLLLFLAIPAGGQQITITTAFQQDTIWIGQQTRFTITAEQPSDLALQFPPVSDTLHSSVEILEEVPADTTNIGDERIRIRKVYRVTSFDRGDHFIEPLTFVFETADGDRTLSTSRTRIVVLSPEIDQEAGIYDIKDPMGVPVGLLEVLPWILGALLTALLIWLAYKYYRRRQNVEATDGSGPEPGEPPHVTALRELKKLKSGSLCQEGRVKEYYTRMTGIIRIYIERRFRILAMEKTSEEIISDLYANKAINSEVVDVLKNCFSLADLVKFARATPDEAENEESLDTAFYFVKATFEMPVKHEQADGSGGENPDRVTDTDESSGSRQSESVDKKDNKTAFAEGIEGVSPDKTNKI